MLFTVYFHLTLIHQFPIGNKTNFGCTSNMIKLLTTGKITLNQCSCIFIFITNCAFRRTLLLFTYSVLVFNILIQNDRDRAILVTCYFIPPIISKPNTLNIINTRNMCPLFNFLHFLSYCVILHKTYVCYYTLFITAKLAFVFIKIQGFKSDVVVFVGQG